MLLNNLKPCPFCGKYPVVVEDENILGEKEYKIVCSYRKCVINPGTPFYSDPDWTEYAWNDRKGETNGY